MLKFKIKKVGNHYYPCVIHTIEDHIVFNYKIELFLDNFIKTHDIDGDITVTLEELEFIPEDTTNVVFFNEEDITKFYMDDDDFEMRIEVNDEEFKISAALFDCLEKQFNADFDLTLYQISLS